VHVPPCVALDCSGRDGGGKDGVSNSRSGSLVADRDVDGVDSIEKVRHDVGGVAWRVTQSHLIAAAAVGIRPY
jgi:hypothetical protein